jgi:hypothetical protein
MPTVAFPRKHPLSPRGGRALLWIGLAIALAAALLVVAFIGGATTRTLFGELDRVSGFVNERGEASRQSETGPVAPVQPATPAPPATPPESVAPERLRVLMTAPGGEYLVARSLLQTRGAVTLASDTTRRRITASAVRYDPVLNQIASDSAFTATAGTRQLSGVGFTAEYFPHIYLKRAKLNEALFGTRVVLLDRIADMLEAA